MKKIFTFCIASAAVIVMIFVSWNWPGWRDPAHPDTWAGLSQFAWAVVAGCIVVFLVIVSMGVTKRPLGFLINERNLMSLSRFQTVLWMVIILSSYFVIAVSKVVMGLPDPLEIGVDEKLWALMGISLTSLVGTSLINSTKTNKNPDNREVEKTAKALVESNNLPVSVARAEQPEKVATVVKEIKANREGTLYANPSTADASFNDMFQGDECGNAAYIDMAKVQMFFSLLWLR